MVRFSPRMAHPKIEELALQAQGVGIFAAGEILPLIDPFLLQKTRPFSERQGACFLLFKSFLGASSHLALDSTYLRLHSTPLPSLPILPRRYRCKRNP